MNSQRREQHERNRELLLVRVQPRRDEQPDLIHDERRRHDQADDEGELQVQRERFARLREDELAARRQRLHRRRHEERVDLRDERERDENADADRQRRVDDAFPELVEMIEERHPLARCDRRRRRAEEETPPFGGLGTAREPSGVRPTRCDRRRVPQPALQACTAAGGVVAGVAVLAVSRVVRCSSMRISSSSVLRSSFEAFLNSARLLAERLAQFRQLARAEDDQGNDEDDDQLRHADGTKHIFPLSNNQDEPVRRHYRNRYGAGQGNPRGVVPRSCCS